MEIDGHDEITGEEIDNVFDTMRSKEYEDGYHRLDKMKLNAALENNED